MEIELTKGGRFNLSKEAPNLKKFAIGLGWQASRNEQSYDIDVSVFMLGSNGKVPDEKYFVFYNNLQSLDGSLRHSGDNQTGEGKGDDETIYLDLAKINSVIQEIVFVVTIHQAEEKQQNFSQVRNSFIKIYNQETRRSLVRYNLREHFAQETALEFGRLYKKDGEWRFQAVGEGYNTGLKSFVDKYVEETKQEEKKNEFKLNTYDRLNLTRPSRKLKVPIWERIDLTRPAKLRCLSCSLRMQSQWEFCPSCGQLLIHKDREISRCIWIDLSGMDIAEENTEAMTTLFIDAFSKLYGAFRSVNVFLTSEPPDINNWGEDFTHVYILADNQPVDYLGVATFQLSSVTNRAIVRIDQVFYTSHNAGLNVNQLSNLIANTIAHEIGHTLGLDHSALPTDVMHDGLDHIVHSLMPPSFHASQLNSMNKAIRSYVKGNTNCASVPSSKCEGGLKLAKNFTTFAR